MKEKENVKQNLSYISSWSHVWYVVKRFFTRKNDTYLQSLQSSFGNESYTKHTFIELNNLVLADASLSDAEKKHSAAQGAYDSTEKPDNNSSYFSQMKSYFQLKRAEFSLSSKANALSKAKKSLSIAKENFALEKLKCTGKEDSLEAAVLKSSGSFMSLCAFRDALVRDLMAPADFYTDDILKEYASYKVADVANVMSDLNKVRYVTQSNTISAADKGEFQESDVFLKKAKELYKSNSHNQWRLAVRVSKCISKQLAAEIKNCDYHLLCEKVKDANKGVGEAKGLSYILYKLSHTWHAMWKLCYTKTNSVEGVDYGQRKADCKKKLAAIQNSRPLFLFPWRDYKEAKNTFVLSIEEGQECVKGFGRDEKYFATILEQDTYSLLVANAVPNLQKDFDDADNNNGEKPGYLSQEDLNRDMMEAVFRNDVKEVKHLLDIGADVDATDSSGKTAVDHTKNEEIKILLRAKACGDLAYAVATADTAKIKEILPEGHAVEKKDLNSAIKYAVLAGNYDAASFLLSAGADSNAKGKDGKTLLIWAAYKKYPKIVKLLLDMGANYGDKDKYGNTALYYATDETIKKLLNSKKDSSNLNNVAAISLGTAIFRSPKPEVDKKENATPSSVALGPGSTT